MGLAILFGLLAAVGFGSSAVLARLGLERIPPTKGVLLSLSTGFLFTFALSLALHFRDVITLSPRAFLWFLFFAVITFPLARLMNYTAISLAGASRSSPLLSVSPIFATLLALIALGETPNLLIVTGILISVLGMGLIVSEKRTDAA